LVTYALPESGMALEGGYRQPLKRSAKCSPICADRNLKSKR
jgi:hypothetical protein